PVFSVGRYCFTVTDFHHLPPAGLPRAPQLNTWPVVSPVNASRWPSRDAAHRGLGGWLVSSPHGGLSPPILCQLSWRTPRWVKAQSRCAPARCAGQEPRGRKPAERTALAGLRAPS